MSVKEEQQPHQGIAEDPIRAVANIPHPLAHYELEFLKAIEEDRKREEQLFKSEQASRIENTDREMTGIIDQFRRDFKELGEDADAGKALKLIHKHKELLTQKCDSFQLEGCDCTDHTIKILDILAAAITAYIEKTTQLHSKIKSSMICDDKFKADNHDALKKAMSELSVESQSALFNSHVRSNWNIFNHHKNSKLDSFFRIHNTASWRETWQEMRDAATEKLLDEIWSDSGFEKETLEYIYIKDGGLFRYPIQFQRLNEAINQGFFCDHIQNTWFKGAFGKTDAVNRFTQEMDVLYGRADSALQENLDNLIYRGDLTEALSLIDRARELAIFKYHPKTILTFSHPDVVSRFKKPTLEKLTEKEAEIRRHPDYAPDVVTDDGSSVGGESADSGDEKGEQDAHFRLVPSQEHLKNDIEAAPSSDKKEGGSNDNDSEGSLVRTNDIEPSVNTGATRAGSGFDDSRHSASTQALDCSAAMFSCSSPTGDCAPPARITLPPLSCDHPSLS